MATPFDCTFAAQFSYSLSRLLGSMNALISELHQADIRRHDGSPLAEASQIAISEPALRWCGEGFKNAAEQIRVRNRSSDTAQNTGL
jgi:hypothetical protein